MQFFKQFIEISTFQTVVSIRALSNGRFDTIASQSLNDRVSASSTTVPRYARYACYSATGNPVIECPRFDTCAQRTTQRPGIEMTGYSASVLKKL